MKSARKALTRAYKQLLTGLTYNGQSVAVYVRMAPDKGTGDQYVILGPWTPTDDNNKDSFGEKGTLLIDVVCRFPAGIISVEPSATIAEEITTRLKPEPGAETLVVDGFNCWNTKIMSVGNSQHQPIPIAYTGASLPSAISWSRFHNHHSL